MGLTRIPGSQVLDGGLTNADIASDAAIAVSKLASSQSTLIGTKVTGGVVAMTPSEARTVLNISSFKYYKTYTWLIDGEIKVASSNSNQLGSITLKLTAGQTAKLNNCIYSIYDGTSATLKLQQNGSDMTGFTSMSVGTTESATTPTAITLSDDDKIAPIVTAVSGTPHLLKVELVIEFTITIQ